MINVFRGDVLCASGLFLIRNEIVSGDDSRTYVILDHLRAFKGVSIPPSPNSPHNQQREISKFVAGGSITPRRPSLRYR